MSLKVIDPVYLLDAALEVLLIGGWAFALWQGRAGGAAVARERP